MKTTTEATKYTLIDAHTESSDSFGKDLSVVILESDKGKRFVVKNGFNPDDRLRLWRYGFVIGLKDDDTFQSLEDDPEWLDWALEMPHISQEWDVDRPLLDLDGSSASGDVYRSV